MDLEFEEFEKETALKVIKSADGRTLTTACVGGALSRLVIVDTLEQLQRSLKFINKKSKVKSYKILGNGSNLLINDHGVDDWVLQLGSGFKYINEVKGEDLFQNEEGSIKYLIGAGCYLPNISQKLSALGYAGLEFAGGIPGSVGGAIYMNAGAHGGEMSKVISKVFCLNSAGEERILEKEDLTFSYRSSGIPKDYFIYQVELELEVSDKEKTNELRAKNLAHRKATQPLTLPSFGSVFKNPSGISSSSLSAIEEVNLSAGKLIESCGLKGIKIGDAEISTLHGNWIVNPSKKALAKDVMQLIELCKQRVIEEKGIELKEEVVKW